MKKVILTMCVIGAAMGLCIGGPARAEEKALVGEECAGEEASVVEVQPVIEMPVPVKKPLVQMAILLDTSGSMSGLIDQARAELWAIVNEFIFARRGGMEPEVQVALYEYGKNSISSKVGYIRQIVPFTLDLDKVSEELFALKTNGGSEYCGWVIQEATKSLKWSSEPDDLKVIFIAGNEEFTQGPVDYRKSCKAAIAKGIVVNTLHCGSDSAGLSGKWKDGALLADGKYVCINHNRQIVHVAAPQDKEIAVLGLRLNDTYITYGESGQLYYERQSSQDHNASDLSKEAELQRAVAKASFNYRNDNWDLVDALKNETVKLEEVKVEDLPENMRKMSEKERRAYVESQAKLRADVQQKIQKLNEKRKKYVAAEMKKRQKDGDSLGSAITKAVREQAKKRNFTFESSKKPSKKVEGDASK